MAYAREVEITGKVNKTKDKFLLPVWRKAVFRCVFGLEMKDLM